MGGWKELSLPDSQATQLAGAAVQKYLVKVGVAASLGCKSAAKPQAASAPVISSGRQQVYTLNPLLWQLARGPSARVRCVWLTLPLDSTALWTECEYYFEESYPL